MHSCWRIMDELGHMWRLGALDHKPEISEAVLAVSWSKAGVVYVVNAASILSGVGNGIGSKRCIVRI